MPKFSAFIAAILFAVIALFPTSKINAGSLDQAQIILDRLSPNTSISGLVCANPSSSQTENKIQINFPSDFTVSSNTTNWTTSTTNIPSGSSAWPGVGSSAQSVSSKTVTFSSSDLSLGTRYCFRFSSSLSKTGTAGSKSIEIRTLDTGSNIIDSRTVTIHILNSDQINVNATVPAKSSDLNVEVIKINPPGHIFQQDISMNMGINYSTNFDYPVDAVLVAEWEQGTFENQSSPNIDVANYIPQTAKLAYGNSVPVIDLINKTITWTIDNLPGSVIHRTEFDLSVIRPYIGDLSINFPVSARLYVISAVKENTLNLVYRTNFEALTPPPGPTSTPVPSLTPTPTPRFRIGTVNINSISSDSASIYVSFNKKAKPTIRYGDNPDSLNKSVTSLNDEYRHNITLNNLTPDTQYYFRVLGNTPLGESQSVEIYTFRTAKSGKAPTPDGTSLIVSSQKSIIFNKDLLDSIKQKLIILPSNTLYTIQLLLSNSELIKQVSIRTSNNNVLGVFASENNSQEYIEDYTDMTEVSPGIFTANLRSPLSPDTYRLTLKTSDYNGGISLSDIIEIRVSKPLTVLDPNKNPIENARVKIRIYSPKTKLYEDLKGNLVSNNIQIKTDSNGFINEALPIGKYQVEVNATGYSPRTVDFQLGTRPDQNYPEIMLIPLDPSLLTFIKYNIETFSYNLSDFLAFIDGVSRSNRLYSLINLLVIIVFIVLGLIAFFHRIKLPLRHSHDYIINHSKKILRNNNQKYQIQIIDSESKLPIQSCHIFILDSNKTIIDVSTTNKSGFANINIPNYNLDLSLKIIRKNFKPCSQNMKENQTVYEIASKENLQVGKIKNAASILIERSFELILVLGISFELIFALSLGIWKALPFLLISILNLILFINHKRLTSYSSSEA